MRTTGFGSIAILLLVSAPRPAAAAGPADSDGAPQYSLKKSFAVGGEGGWDYITVDAAARRLYVARSTHVMILEEESGKLIADLPNTPGVHGVAIAPESGRGFTSNGRGNNVTVFDLKTLKAIETIPTGQNPDAILFDPESKLVFTMNGRSGDVTAIPADAKDGKGAQNIPVEGKLEAGVVDGKGHLYVNVEDKGEVARIDLEGPPAAAPPAGAPAVRARWSLAPGQEPSGLAIDLKRRRLFAGCRNKMMVVMDLEAGKVIATPPIGSGVDGCAFDQETGLAFASCGDGTLTIVKETSPGKFDVVQTVKTKPGAKTMAIDPKTHVAYLPTAEYEAGTGKEGGKRRAVKPGSFEILVVAPR